VSDSLLEVGAIPLQWRFRAAAATLVVFYLVGTLGILSPWRDTFVALSFANLVLTALLLLSQAHALNRRAILAFLLCGVAGFVVEAVGVATNVVFGEYSYTGNLGPRLLGVPLVIGLNWAVLAHAIHACVSRFSESARARVLIGATAMTAFDFVMEPAAIALDYWRWKAGIVPLKNYVAWWVISVILFLMVENLSKATRNRLGPWVLGCMLGFFLVARWGGR
jgi:putative membrane protein